MISPNPYFEKQQVLILSGVSGTVCAVHRLRICCPFPNRFCVASPTPPPSTQTKKRRITTQLQVWLWIKKSLRVCFQILTLWPWHAFSGTVSYRRFCNLSLLVFSYGLKILRFDANIWRQRYFVWNLYVCLQMLKLRVLINIGDSTFNLNRFLTIFYKYFCRLARVWSFRNLILYLTNTLWRGLNQVRLVYYALLHAHQEP